MDLTTLLLLLAGFALATSSQKAQQKTENDQKGASSDYKKSASSDYKDVTGPDDKGNNYIPFQWQVEIIKREYDDYVLPDGTVYRVPQGAVPPHRYKGSAPYDVPYYVFKGEGHSDHNYGNRPKLVETFDHQTLELMLQDWYEEELWSRGYLGNNRRYPASQDYYGDYDSGHGGNSAYAPSEKHEKTYGRNVQPSPRRNVQSLAPRYFMRSFNGTQRWSDRDYSPASSRTSSRVAVNNYGSSPQIGQSGKLNPPKIGGEKSAFPSASATNLRNNNKASDSTTRVASESGFRPSAHPFINRFRDSLTSGDNYENYS